jgi:cytochrome c2
MGRTLIAVAVLLMSTGPVWAEDNLVWGKDRYEFRCAQCHAIGGSAAKSGPDLTDIVGRPAAALEGFKYSPAMIEAGQAGVVWDLETLSKFIEKPRSVVNGSNMAFTGYREPADVAAVVAYIATFSAPTAQ